MDAKHNHLTQPPDMLENRLRYTHITSENEEKSGERQTPPLNSTTRLQK